MIYDSYESYLDSIRKYDFMNMDENCRIFSLLSAMHLVQQPMLGGHCEQPASQP